jgi:hypothetical protein
MAASGRIVFQHEMSDGDQGQYLTTCKIFNENSEKNINDSTTRTALTWVTRIAMELS